MEFTIREAHQILQELDYKKGWRTVHNAREKLNLGRKSGGIWLITLEDLKKITAFQGGHFTDEQWQEAIRDARDKI